MPRFVVLEHDHPELHWDLMLEAAGGLRTWRLSSPPAAGEVVRAAASFDHRLHYLDYEGPVSGGRGHVQRWDGGTFSLELDSDDRLIVHFEGQRLRGRAHLERVAEDVWRLTAEEHDDDGGQGQQSGADQSENKPA